MINYEVMSLNFAAKQWPQNCTLFSYLMSYSRSKVQDATYKHLPNRPGQVKFRFGQAF